MRFLDGKTRPIEGRRQLYKAGDRIWAQKQHWPVVGSGHESPILAWNVPIACDDCALSGPEPFDGIELKRGNFRKQWRNLIYSRGQKFAFFEGHTSANFLVLDHESFQTR